MSPTPAPPNTLLALFVVALALVCALPAFAVNLADVVDPSPQPQQRLESNPKFPDRAHYELMKAMKVMVGSELDEAARAFALEHPYIAGGAGVDHEGVLRRSGSRVLISNDPVNGAVVLTANHAIRLNGGAPLSPLYQVFGNNVIDAVFGLEDDVAAGFTYEEALSRNRVWEADPNEVHVYPSQDVALVRLKGLVTDEEGNLIDPIPFYTGVLASGDILCFGGAGEIGNPNDQENGVWTGDLAAAWSTLSSIGIAGTELNIGWMRFPSSSTVPSPGGSYGYGDSGGPTMKENDGTFYLVGINTLAKPASRLSGFERIDHRVNDLTVAEWALEIMASTSAEGEGEAALIHSADTNGDWQFNLSELLRVVQFYNARDHHCAEPGAQSEDQYLPGLDPAKQDCAAHASDYDPQDWRIDLPELLRGIQLFNSGAYHACPGGEDGYCAGPAEAD